MLSIYQRAIRFADLWAVDHHRMVDEVYAPNIHMETMYRLANATIEGNGDLHALEDRLAALIPLHRHELVRVLAGERHACLETTVVSPTTGEYTPACVWWWMGANGQVDEEVGFFDWDRRTNDSHVCHGFVPPSGDWPCDKMDALIDALRAGDLGAHVTPGTVVEDVGVGPCELDFGPVEVQEVVADGPAVATLIVGRDAASIWRSTVVMTAGADGSLVSVRCYGGPWMAVPREAVHPGMNLSRQPTV